MKLKPCFVCLAFSMFNCCIVLQTFTIFIDLIKVKNLQRYDNVSYFRQIDNIIKVTNSFLLSLFKHLEHCILPMSLFSNFQPPLIEVSLLKYYVFLLYCFLIQICQNGYHTSFVFNFFSVDWFF